MLSFCSSSEIRVSIKPSLLIHLISTTITFFLLLAIKRILEVFEAVGLTKMSIFVRHYLQQRWVYLESSENCSLRPATIVGTCRVYTEREGEHFCREERKLKGYYKLSSHWLNPSGRRGLFSSCWTLLFLHGMRLPLLVCDSI